MIFYVSTLKCLEIYFKNFVLKFHCFLLGALLISTNCFVHCVQNCVQFCMHCVQKLKKEYDAALKGQATAKKQLEDETIMRVDLENRIQSLKEELAFQTEVHKQVSTAVSLFGASQLCGETISHCCRSTQSLCRGWFRRSVPVVGSEMTVL